MSRIRANQITNQSADGAPTVQHGLIIAGVSTFTGSVSIGGTLTYEDVTNIDSIGIVTARGGIHIDDSIVHIGDTDTKIRFPAADTVTVETAGSERLRITSTGAIGIGTNNPISGAAGARLAVHLDDNTSYAGGTARGNGIIVYNRNAGGHSSLELAQRNSANTYGTVILNAVDPADGNDYGADFTIQTRATGSGNYGERLRITSGGKLLVGTSSDYAENVQAAFYGASNGGIALASGTSGSSRLMFADGTSGSGTGAYIGSIIYAHSDNSMRFTTNVSERLRINSNGSIQITPEGSTSNPYMLIDTSGDSVRFSAQKASGNNEFRFLTQSSGTVAERLRITSNGNVSINTTADVQKLRVYDSRGAAGYKTALFESNDTANGTRIVIANTGSTSGRGLGINVGGQSYGPGQDRASFGWYNPDNTYSYLNALTLTADGVMAHGQFANFAYSSLPAFFNIINGARVNTGGANQFAAPKGGFCDNARYELEASLISYSTSAQQTIQAQNGARLKISDSRSNWSYYNNLPNYLLGHAATDCINTSNYTLTLKATMTVFLQRSNGWNSVPLSGWELLESNTDIYPGNTDSRLYVKTLAAGSYSGWDSDSAMYFFVL